MTDLLAATVSSLGVHSSSCYFWFGYALVLVLVEGALFFVVVLLCMGLCAWSVLFGFWSYCALEGGNSAS